MSRLILKVTFTAHRLPLACLPSPAFPVQVAPLARQIVLAALVRQFLRAERLGSGLRLGVALGGRGRLGLRRRGGRFFALRHLVLLCFIGCVQASL